MSNGWKEFGSQKHTFAMRNQLNFRRYLFQTIICGCIRINPSSMRYNWLSSFPVQWISHCIHTTGKGVQSRSKAVSYVQGRHSHLASFTFNDERFALCFSCLWSWTWSMLLQLIIFNYIFSFVRSCSPNLRITVRVGYQHHAFRSKELSPTATTRIDRVVSFRLLVLWILFHVSKANVE